MNTSIRKIVQHVLVLASLFVLTGMQAAEPYTRSTYHCLSIYWNSPNLGTCKVEYKAAGSSAWLLGQNLPYSKIDPSVTKNSVLPKEEISLLNQYRGSLVNLTPGTAYSVRLTAGTQVKTFTAATRSEVFKIKKTIKVGNLTRGYATTEGGSASTGYVLYDGTGSTIDSNFTSQFGISIKHSYVIIRGFKVQRSTSHGIVVNGKYSDVIIENCEVTNYGSKENFPGYSISSHCGGITVMPEAKRVTIQRNNIHHPRYPASRWGQIKGHDHPFGAKAIQIGNSDGMHPWEANHVVRYNSCYTDAAHAFEDVMNGYPNYSKTGFPGADSDIYSNLIQNGTDDLIEADGGGQNVRIWGNYLDGCTAGVSLQSCTIGPVYIFRNVFAHGGAMFKFAGNNWAWGGKKGSTEAFFFGPVFVFHNTSLVSGSGGFNKAFGTYPHDDDRNITSRNNVFMTAKDYVTSGYTVVPNHPRFVNCSFDYDLHNRASKFKGDQGADYDKHGFMANAVWRSGHGAVSPSGRYQLAQGSKGYNGGLYLPNFNLGSGEEGHAPDMGACEFNSKDMIFGTKASWAPLGGGHVVAVPPAAPSALTSSSVSSSQINLSWSNNADDATEIKIERKTGSTGTYAQIATVSPDVASFNNTGLKAGTTYYYRVRATNAVGDSAYTNETSAKTQTAIVKPVITSASTASAPVNGSLSYQITASANPTSYGASGLPAGLSVDAKTGLISGTVNTAGVYKVTVSATNASGTGSASIDVTIVTVSMAKPTNLTAVLAGNTVNLNWIDNSSDETSFRVRRKEGPLGTFEYLKSVNSKETSYIDTTAVSGKTYSYIVRVCRDDASGPVYSEWSDEVSVTIP